MSVATFAAEPGKAVGSVTIGGAATTLNFATEKKVEGLFDPKKQDTLIVLSDKPIGATEPDDEIGLSMRARTGEITVLALRHDGTKLVNVKVSHKGVSGFVALPGNWFQYSGKPGAGTLKLTSRDFDGRSYACSVEFSATPDTKPAAAKTTSAAPAPAPKPAPAPAKLPP